jgi:hypothetical protein
VLVAVGDTTRVPDVGSLPDQLPEPVQDVAVGEDQVSVLPLPITIEAALAERVTAGGTAGTAGKNTAATVTYESMSGALKSAATLPADETAAVSKVPRFIPQFHI